jgi:predicted nucleotidyltransferase
VVLKSIDAPESASGLMRRGPSSASAWNDSVCLLPFLAVSGKVSLRMTLLQQIESDRRQRRERLRLEARSQLRSALCKLAPAEKVIVFGSLTKPGGFSETSDVDLALEAEPVGLSVCQLTSLLAESLGRPVDVVLLPECRFRDKILREGETWTLPA